MIGRLRWYFRPNKNNDNEVSSSSNVNTEQSPTDLVGDQKFGGALIADEHPSRVEEIVTFTDAVDPLVDHKYISTDVPEIYPVESIKEWLKRPLEIGSGVWNTTDTIDTMIFSANFPGALLNKEVLGSKIANFRYFRADIKLAIRLNGLRTQFGKLMMTWSPYTDSDDEHFKRTSSIYSLIGYPHVIVSPTESEVVELIVPFISPYQWFDRLFAGQSEPPSQLSGKPYGNVFLYVFNVLQNVTDTTPVYYTIYANFENISLTGYMGVAGSNGPSTSEFKPVKSAYPVKEYDSYRPQAKTMRSGGFISGSSQSRESAPVAGEQVPETIEAESKASKGVISSTLDTVGGIAAALSPIPGLGAVAAPVAAISSVGSTIASLFGFSKPDTVAAVEPRTIRYLDTAHAVGLDSSVKLAMTQENSVKSGIRWMGGVDVMSFDHICSVPMLLSINAWPEAAPKGTLFDYEVAPLAVHTELNVPVTDVFPTYLSHVANAFQYWRADLRYYIAITASAFHSGRLRFTFDPGNAATSDPNHEFAVNRVVDIQTETEFSFTIPFMYEAPYCRTGTYRSPGSIGKVYCTVVNPLISTATGSTNAYINVLVSATNVQFGGPRRVLLDEIITNELRPQALTNVAESIAEYPPLIPATASYADGVAMGEYVSSVKDMIMRPGSYISFKRSVESGLLKKNDPAVSTVKTGYVDFTRSVTTRSTTITGVPLGRHQVTITCGYLPPNDGGEDAYFTISANSFPLATQWYQNFSGTYNKVAQQFTVIYEATSDSITFLFESTERGSGAARQVGYDCNFVIQMSFIAVDFDITVPPIEIPPIDPPDFEPSERRDIGVLLNTPLFTPYTPIEVDDNLFLYSSGFSYLAYFSSIYRFWRGSTRYKLCMYRGVTMATIGASRLTYLAPANTAPPVEFIGNTALGGDVDFNAGTSLARSPVSNTLEVTWPYYQPTFSIVSADIDHYYKPPDDTRERLAFMMIQDQYQINDEVQGSILQSAGDDFEFGFLVPPPRFSLSIIPVSRKDRKVFVKTKQNSRRTCD